MSTETLMLFAAIALIVVALPAWPYSKSWGYVPTGVLAVLLLVFLVWAVAAERPLFRRTEGQDLKSAVQEAGEDVKDAGRDVADSIKRTVE